MRSFNDHSNRYQVWPLTGPFWAFTSSPTPRTLDDDGTSSAPRVSAELLAESPVSPPVSLGPSAPPSAASRAPGRQAVKQEASNRRPSANVEDWRSVPRLCRPVFQAASSKKTCLLLLKFTSDSVSDRTSQQNECSSRKNAGF